MTGCWISPWLYNCAFRGGKLEEWNGCNYACPTEWFADFGGLGPMTVQYAVSLRAEICRAMLSRLASASCRAFSFCFFLLTCFHSSPCVCHFRLLPNGIPTNLQIIVHFQKCSIINFGTGEFFLYGILLTYNFAFVVNNLRILVNKAKLLAVAIYQSINIQPLLPHFL